jgi:hypothetical protein
MIRLLAACALGLAVPRSIRFPPKIVGRFLGPTPERVAEVCRVAEPERESDILIRHLGVF